MKSYSIITIVVRDKHDKVISRSRQKSRSYVRGLNFITMAQFEGSSTPSPAIQTKDTAGTTKNLRTSGNAWTCAAAIGATVNGIRVGTGNTAVTIEDYQLETPIAQGLGAGQMEHQAVTFVAPQVSGNECFFSIERIIVNNSGAVITVREAGIYCQAMQVTATPIYICVARDVLAPAKDVPDGGSITVTYTIKDVA